MATGIGLKAFLGIGEESTYGTPVARTKFLQILSESLVTIEEKAESLSVSNVDVTDQDVWQGVVDVNGDVQFHVPFEGAELLFKHAFGSVTSTQDGATGIYDHVFSLADSLPTGLSLEINRDISSFTHAGCKIDTLELNIGGVSEFLRATCGIIGRDVATASASTAVYPDFPKFKGTEFVLTWNSVSIPVTNFGITLNNNLDKTSYTLGSRFRREPVRNDKRRISGTFNALFEDLTQFNDFRTSTNRALIGKFTGPLIPGGTTQTYDLKLTCGIGRIDTYPIQVNSMSKLAVDVGFSGLRNSAGTTPALKLEMRNKVVSV